MLHIVFISDVGRFSLHLHAFPIGKPLLLLSVLIPVKHSFLVYKNTEENVIWVLDCPLFNDIEKLQKAIAKKTEVVVFDSEAHNYLSMGLFVNCRDASLSYFVQLF